MGVDNLAHFWCACENILYKEKLHLGHCSTQQRVVQSIYVVETGLGNAVGPFLEVNLYCKQYFGVSVVLSRNVSLLFPTLQKKLVVLTTECLLWLQTS